MFAKWVAEDGRFAFSMDDNGGVEISPEQHAALLTGEAAGSVIAPDGNGVPTLRPRLAAVPATVTMRQARLALIDAGKYAAVQAAVAQADDRTRVEWEFAATVERDSPIVALLAQAVGLDDGTLDTLFTAAAAL